MAQWAECTSSILHRIHNHSHSEEESTERTRVCSGAARQRTGRQSLGCKVWRWFRLCLLGAHLTLERWAIGAKTAIYLQCQRQPCEKMRDWCRSGWKALCKSHLMRVLFASSGWFRQHADFDFRCETASLGHPFRCWPVFGGFVWTKSSIRELACKTIFLLIPLIVANFWRISSALGQKYFCLKFDEASFFLNENILLSCFKLSLCVQTFLRHF